MIEPNFASLVLGIAVVEGLGRSLDPNVDIIKTSLPILLKARLRRALAADAFGDQSERDDWEASLAMDSF
jgi:predicted unusual protein kinase regulating ubiquinone biosynthesis (AarF/ABC1/UbiB family)